VAFGYPPGRAIHVLSPRPAVGEGVTEKRKPAWLKNRKKAQPTVNREKERKKTSAPDNSGRKKKVGREKKSCTGKKRSWPRSLGLWGGEREKRGGGAGSLGTTRDSRLNS